MLELFENIVQTQKREHGTTDTNSQTGPTPPRIVQQADNGRNHSENDDEDEPLVLSVLRGHGGGNDNGGNGDSDDGDNRTHANSNQREETNGGNNTTAFALVNSRDIELN